MLDDQHRSEHVDPNADAMKKRKKALMSVDLREVQDQAMNQQKRMNRNVKNTKNHLRREERVKFKQIGSERYKINLEGLLEIDDGKMMRTPDKGLGLGFDKTGDFTTPDEIRVEFPDQTPNTPGANPLDYSSNKLLGDQKMNESDELSEEEEVSR